MFELKAPCVKIVVSLFIFCNTCIAQGLGIVIRRFKQYFSFEHQKWASHIVPNWGVKAHLLIRLPNCLYITL